MPQKTLKTVKLSDVTLQFAVFLIVTVRELDFLVSVSPYKWFLAWPGGLTDDFFMSQ
jgi:hypothetical protein